MCTHRVVHFVLCGTLQWYSPHPYWVGSPIGNPCSRSLFPHGCLLIDYLSESESEGERGGRASVDERQRETLMGRERESWWDETGSGTRMRKKRKTSAKWNWATTWMTRGSEERWEDETSRGNLNPNHSSLSLFHRHFSSLSFPLTLLFVVYPHFIIFSFGCIRHVWNYSCVVLTEQLLICVHSLVTWINLTRSSLAKSHYCCCTHLKLYMDANKHLHQFCFWDCPPEKKNSTTCLSKGSKNHICDSTCRRKSGYVIMEQKSPH